MDERASISTSPSPKIEMADINSIEFNLDNYRISRAPITKVPNTVTESMLRNSELSLRELLRECSKAVKTAIARKNLKRSHQYRKNSKRRDPVAGRIRGGDSLCRKNLRRRRYSWKNLKRRQKR